LKRRVVIQDDEVYGGFPRLLGRMWLDEHGLYRGLSLVPTCYLEPIMVPISLLLTTVNCQTEWCPWISLLRCYTHNHQLSYRAEVVECSMYHQNYVSQKLTETHFWSGYRCPFTQRHISKYEKKKILRNISHLSMCVYVKFDENLTVTCSV
jgi:hypothetical protein